MKPLSKNFFKNYAKTCFALGTTLAIFATAPTHAATITSLFNTGGGSYANNTTPDSNWTVSGNSTGPSAYVIYDPTNPNGNNWKLSGDYQDNISAWISPATNTIALAGNYTYRTSFNLSGFDLSSVDIIGRWESDNKLVSIVLNADTSPVTITTNSLSNPFSGVTTNPDWSDNSGLDQHFNLSAFLGSYLQGVNTLDFIVNNTSLSDTGLRVQFETQNADSLLPEPDSLVLLGIGLAGFVFARRKMI